MFLDHATANQLFAHFLSSLKHKKILTIILFKNNSHLKQQL